MRESLSVVWRVSNREYLEALRTALVAPYPTERARLLAINELVIAWKAEHAPETH
jgi:hypothetical protein